MAKAHNKADHRADTRGGSWAGIPHKVLDSEAYLDLSLWARAILTEIVRKMNGYNNGKIAVSYAYLSKRLGNTNKRKIGAAIAELVEHGFLDTEADADWKGRRSREYRLTFVNTTPGDKHKQASNDYRDWVKPKQKAGDDALPLKGSNGDDALPLAKKNGDDALPNKFAKLRETAPNAKINPSKNGNASSPLIYNHTPSLKTPTAKPDKTNSKHPETPGGVFAVSEAGQ